MNQSGTILVNGIPVAEVRDLSAKVVPDPNPGPPLNASRSRVDCPALLRRLRGLPVFRGTLIRGGRGPSLVVVWSRTLGSNTAGNGCPLEIRVRIGARAEPADVAELVLHELVHASRPPGPAHGHGFRARLRQAALEAWGIQVGDAVGPGFFQNRAYALDETIRAELGRLIAAGTVTIPTIAPVAQDPVAVAKRRRLATQALIDRRAAHAARMFQRAAQRLKRAQAAAARWRVRVRYYEQRAAKSAKKGGPHD